jgi:hypothetical protein
MNTATRLVVVLLSLSAAAAETRASKHPNSSCAAYFVVAEKDSTTVNLNMLGLSEPQQKWYKKHGGEFPSLCLVNGDASGKRVTQDEASEAYMNSVVGDAPLFLIAWEEHKVFVPDDNGGHYAWSANGTLSRWDKIKQDFVAVAPIHSTNRTIFTSASTSLLKDGLKEIESRNKQCYVWYNLREFLDVS